MHLRDVVDSAAREYISTLSSHADQVQKEFKAQIEQCVVAEDVHELPLGVKFYRRSGSYICMAVECKPTVRMIKIRDDVLGKKACQIRTL